MACVGRDGRRRGSEFILADSPLIQSSAGRIKAGAAVIWHVSTIFLSLAGEDGVWPAFAVDGLSGEYDAVIVLILFCFLLLFKGLLLGLGSSRVHFFCMVVVVCIRREYLPLLPERR